jgi:outer membrane protein OmpA-like peptidoglycan-associated protein
MLKHITVVAAALALVAAPRDADAQGMMERMKKRAEEAAKRKIEQRVDQRAGEATDAALDKVECAATDKACIDKAKADGKTVVTSGTAAAGEGAATGGATGGSAARAAGAPSAGSASLRPGEGAWANYDFKPGDRVLFADDFSREEVGNFPRSLTFKSGSIDLVEWQGRRWLSAPGRAEFHIPLAQPLPERYTVEFDLAGSGNSMTMSFDGRTTWGTRAPGGDWLELNAHGGGIRSTERQAMSEYGVNTENTPVHVAVTVDGDYAKVYVNEKRIANVPNAKLGRGNVIYVDMNGWSEKQPRMLANFRVAAGGKKLYEALASAGRVATQGIYFDTGSDRIRPESSPTLKEIGAMLSEHPELKLAIEGHTDNVGAAAANTTLSQQRADAVKAALVASYSVDASRLTAKGLGATRPATGNDTPAGRQQNRRVELVKM